MTTDQQKALALAAARQRAAQAQQQPTAPGPAAAPAVTSAAQSPAAAPQPAPQGNGDAGIPGILGDVVSGMNALSDTATFGAAPAIMHAVVNALSPGAGDDMAAKQQAVNDAHPAGVVAGTLASIPVDMMATAGVAGPLAAAADAAPIARTLLKGGGLVGNVLRTAGAGSVMGGVNAATHGDDVATGAGLGAALGPAGAAVGHVIGLGVEKLLAPAATKAWRYLAGKLGENPDQLIGHVTQYVGQTGKQPSLQQIMSDHDSGVIAQFGTNYPAAGEVLRAGAQASDAALPAAAQDVITGAQRTLPAAPALISHINPATATKQALLDARDAGTTTAMDAIRTTPVPLDAALRKDVLHVLGNNRSTAALRTRIASGTTTLDDADRIRRRLDILGNGAVPNPDIQDIAAEVETLARKTVPAYDTVLGQHLEASNYADAFEHGATGAAPGAATDAKLRAALRTTAGQNGFNAGSLSNTAAKAGGTPAEASGVLADISRPGTAQNAFNAAAGPAAAPAAEAAAALRTAGERARTSAPGALRPQPETSSGAANLLTGIAEAPAAPISAVRNVTRGMYQLMTGTKISTVEQRVIAQHLTSTTPAVRDAAVARLRAAGLSAARLKIIQGLAASRAAQVGTSYGDNPHAGVVINASGG